MKTFIDRLREMPVDDLRKLIEKQKSEIEGSQRDLSQMEKILEEHNHAN